MGIYLPKVDMPQGDETLTIQICPDGSIWQRFRGTVPGAKAVPVPPHGRLIEETSAFEHVAEYAGGYVSLYLIKQGLQVTPTIIPAEEVNKK